MAINTHNRERRFFEEEIFMWGIWKVIFRKWQIILLAAVLCGATALLGTKLFIAPTYQASFTAYINNSNQSTISDTLTTQDITASRNLTSTYATIIKSQPDIEAAIKDAGLDLEYKEVEKEISIGAVNDTEIILISVVTTDPERSYKLATSLQKVAPEYVAGIVAGSSMMVIAPAIFPTEIYGPSYLKNTLIGVILGIILAMVCLFIREISDNHVKNVDELSRYGIAVIGTIHDLTVSEKHGYGYYGYEKKGKK